MYETVISVRGEFSASYHPERSTVDLEVAFDGDDRTVVFESGTRSIDTVRASVTALHDAATGPVTSWTADSVNVWSDRPWNSEGKQLPPVFHSRIGLSVVFSDFAALARWIEEVVAIDGVNLAGITWTLTPARLTAATTEVRSRAVKDAVSKATVYAQSIGLGSVRAVAIADPGMLGEQGSPPAGGRPLAVSLAAARSVGAPEVSLKPRDIEVGAVVDARFVAS